jgi:single-stranded-DNA-specific exonuclease
VSPFAGKEPAPSAPLPPAPAPVWELAPAPEEDTVRRLAGELRLPPPLCRVLAARRVTDPEAAKRFLRPLLDDLHPPELLTGAPEAADRILRAVDEGETILVHGDYDVDGVCATALLTLWIRELGGRVTPFVPHRIRDGYDLGPAGIEAAQRAGARLLVTCDCGITAHGAVERARSEGLDVIVTDHHTPGSTLPPALAVVNPARSDCAYPGRGLAGAGVAFKLCHLLARRRGRPLAELLPHLDLVALATVADLVPLEGENRILVRFGLRALAATERPGLRALMQVTGVAGETVEAGQVGFQLAPRLNAAGRMGAANDALRLLLTEDRREAELLARQLDEVNARRRDEDERTLGEALERLRGRYDPREDFGVVLHGEGWHPGVVGIVASRVVERIHRPAVLLSVEEGRARGSARSVPGVDLHAAVKACREHLIRFGGHRQAAGMELEADRIPAFARAFDAAVRGQLDGRTPRPVVRGDAPLRLEEATDELHHFLRYIGPFGVGNPRPVFWARGAGLLGDPRVVGRGHLKLRLGEGRARLEAIGFGLGERMRPHELGRGPVDVLFQLRENVYRGVRSLQARLLDLRPAAAGTEGAWPEGTP